MKSLLEPGKYVVAVSGGIDSIALLHMLHEDKNLELVVAHFDHGIRPDSSEDAKFVSELADKLDLGFFCERAELGPEASEATARTARYDFLDRVKDETGAAAIVTAHHQDDLIETALHNVMRGTRRRGLVSLKSDDRIRRPLLHMAKDEIRQYAREHDLQWREDSTNSDLRYKRNQIRAALEGKLTPDKRKELEGLLKQIDEDNRRIEQVLDEYLSHQPEAGLPRKDLKEFAPEEAHEIVAAWLRKNGAAFDAKTIGRIVEGAGTLQTGAQIDVQGNFYCQVGKDRIVLKRRESV